MQRSPKNGDARRSVGLPRSLRSLFWDCNPARLRWDRDREVILGRVLREGGWSHAQLMRARVGDEAIRAFILRHRGRGMSPNRLRFWQLLLGLPSRQADAWVRTARLSSWSSRANR